MKSFEEDLVIKLPTEIKDADTLAATEKENLDLSYVYSDKNYIVLQGITYCTSFTYEPNNDGALTIFKEPIVDQSEKGSHTYSWNGHALEDYGGYCFAFFLSDEEKPHQSFERIIEELEDQYPTL